MPDCNRCRRTSIEGVYRADTAEWLCARCSCGIAFPYLVRAADMHDQWAIDDYLRRRERG
jgi:ribosomal protein L37AE/L43A